MKADTKKNPTLTDDAKSLLLLCSSLGLKTPDVIRPLTVAEYGKFAKWLNSKELRPSSLLNSGNESILAEMPGSLPDRGRILRLIDRGVALGVAVENWTSQGLWILCRSDHDYPKMLKSRLGHVSPPILYGVGNKALLEAGGLAIVGARNANNDELEATKALGEAATAAGMQVVSGGARGVDMVAMMAALDSGGKSIAVLSDSLTKAVTSAKYRSFLRNGSLALVSPFEPQTHFMVGNAMARNKYVYSLSNWAVVISCTVNKGGTWSGAVENLKAKWRIPLFVLNIENANEGNLQLQDLGARPLTPEEFLNGKIVKTVKAAGQNADEAEVLSELKNNRELQFR